MRTVKDILDTKEAASNFISPDNMVIDALKKLISVNLSYLIVQENGDYKGIFSERDYTRKLVIEGRSSRETKVGEVMTTNLPEAGLDSTVEDCMYKMNMRGARYVAVFDGDEFRGIITIHDLLRQILANKQEVFSDTLTNELLNTDESAKIF
jgi:CBS domain-containing protein